MLKVTKMAAVVVAVSAFVAGGNPALGDATWTGAVDELWSELGNWDGDPTAGGTVVVATAGSSTVDCDTSTWGIGAMTLSGTHFLEIPTGGTLKTNGELKMGPNASPTLKVTGGDLVGNVVYRFGIAEFSGGSWTGGRCYAGPEIHVIGSGSSELSPTYFAWEPRNQVRFTLDAEGVTPFTPTGGDPFIPPQHHGIPLVVDGIENYEGSSGDIIPLFTFADGVTDSDIMDIFPSDMFDYDNTLATLTVDNTGARLEIIGPPGLQWDGGVGNWADLKWDGAAPTAEQDMIINADTADSLVTVAADFITGGTGPATSVFVGEEYDARLTVAGGATLEVTGETTAGEFGKIAVENGGTLQSGSAVIEIDGRLISGVQGSDAGLLDSTGQLTIDDAAAVQVEWMPGADATSMFGGTYTVARYSGTALATTGTTTNGDANIGAAYVKSVDYDVDLGGGVLGIQVELQPQGLGDTDLDGDVDGDDLATFGLAWAPSGTDKTWFDGDFDFDGDIDGDDLAALGLAWAPSGIDFPAGELEVTAVPEPGTIVMLILAAAGLLIYRKRR